ncbi:52 kDa repressor of the inhibitor of the protein kinase-like [Lycorma delicatula]|uniref:52 kDa repressor of the inhibitor of the protein kinase-like n=1 Tax=Lycorma delicatula TaxID=130591 RepID=UPI003F510C11
MFCGTHDLLFRGKGNHEVLFEDLIKLKIGSGNHILKEYIEKSTKNATYLLPQIQNEIISICGDIIRDNITTDIKKACAFGILADKSSDISGKVQLSIEVKFFDEEKVMLPEEFLGNVQLTDIDPKSVASAINNFVEIVGLAEKCIGEGYDGCSSIAGKVSGVQKMI